MAEWRPFLDDPKKERPYLRMRRSESHIPVWAKWRSIVWKREWEIPKCGGISPSRSSKIRLPGFME